MRVISHLVDVLLSDWYPSCKPQVLILCSACQLANFRRQECCALQDPSASLKCINGGSSVSVKEIAPDLALADLTEGFVFQDQDIEFDLIGQEDEGKGKEKDGKEKEKETEELENEKENRKEERETKKNSWEEGELDAEGGEKGIRIGEKRNQWEALRKAGEGNLKEMLNDMNSHQQGIHELDSEIKEAADFLSDLDREIAEFQFIFEEDLMRSPEKEKEGGIEREKKREKERDEARMKDRRVRLGEGAFGVVYKARLLRDGGIPVAVKEMKRETELEREISEFHQEIWMMR